MPKKIAEKTFTSFLKSFSKIPRKKVYRKFLERHEIGDLVVKSP